MGILIFFSACKNKKEVEQPKVPNTPFVSLHENSFYLDGKPFYPVAVNFLVSLQAGNGEVWPTSSINYFEGSKYEFVTKDSSLKELSRQMELIKDMGFNSVRMVGAGEVKSRPGDEFLTVQAFVGNERDTTIVLNDSTAYSNYLNALEILVDIAGESGLKVVLLSSITPDSTKFENHLEKLVTHFKDNTSIMAFDLFNEPLYFDPKERTKPEVRAITSHWNQIVKKNSPNHLTTIGLTGIREVFEWDPDILDVDFISFHPYEYEKEQVRNEMYWYYKYVDKPWIIGETAIPADGDSVSYESQAEFARKTMIQARDCNAKGYTWWQYKDVNWPKFHSSYMGVLNRTGTTLTSNGNRVSGTLKPVVKEFKNFQPDSKKDSCLCFDNYYNYSESPQFRLIGNVVDDEGNPIEGAVVMAWSEDWLKLNHTITKKDGSFELKADFQLNHWIASAIYYDMSKAYVQKEGAVTENGVSRISIGEVRLHKVDFKKPLQQ